MTTQRLQLKIGLFVIATATALVGMSIGLRMCARGHAVRYHTYFDESISGLDEGAAVQFRGLRIGTVGPMTLAPDRRRVDVSLDIAEADARELSLDEHAPALRAKLSTSGITGVKFIDLDPTSTEPPPELAFVPAAHHIPAGTSFIRLLELRVERLSDRVPRLIDTAIDTVDKLGRVLDDMQREKVALGVSRAARQAELAFGDLRGFTRSVDAAALSRRLDAMVAAMHGAATSVRDFVAHVDGDGAIDRAMADVGGAAREFRRFVQEVERDPDVLLKGRERTHRP